MPRTRKCSNCKTPTTTIEFQGAHLCASCMITMQGIIDAGRYEPVIVAHTTERDRWITRAKLDRVILQTGAWAPALLQAVADRVENVTATYGDVVDILRDEISQMDLRVIA